VYAEEETRPRRESQIVQPAVKKIEAKEDAAKRDEFAELLQSGTRIRGQSSIIKPQPKGDEKTKAVPASQPKGDEKTKAVPALQIKTVMPVIPTATFVEGHVDESALRKVEGKTPLLNRTAAQDVRIEPPENLPDNIQETGYDAETDILIDELLEQE
jgi:hypothetical protein